MVHWSGVVRFSVVNGGVMVRLSVVKDWGVVMVSLGGLVVDWSSNMMDSHGRSVMRSLNGVGSFVVHGCSVARGLVVGSSYMGSLVMRASGSMDWSFVMGFSLVHLFGHEFLKERLGNFDVFHMSLFNLVTGSNVCRLVMNWSSLMTWFVTRGLNVSDLGLLISSTVLRGLDISGSCLVAGLFYDIADGALGVSRLSVSGLLNIAGLGIHWLGHVIRLSILRSHVVCIVRSVGFFSRGVGCSKGSANERKSSHFCKSVCKGLT